MGKYFNYLITTVCYLNNRIDYKLTFWDSLLFSGAYNDEEAAARAYDLAALKYWGTSTFTNFPVSHS